jgi:hypothetical protein
MAAARGLAEDHQAGTQRRGAAQREPLARGPVSAGRSLSAPSGNATPASTALAYRGRVRRRQRHGRRLGAARHTTLYVCCAAASPSKSRVSKQRGGDRRQTPGQGISEMIDDITTIASRSSQPGLIVTARVRSKLQRLNGARSLTPESRSSRCSRSSLVPRMRSSSTNQQHLVRRYRWKEAIGGSSPRAIHPDGAGSRTTDCLRR